MVKDFDSLTQAELMESYYGKCKFCHSFIPRDDSEEFATEEYYGMTQYFHTACKTEFDIEQAAAEAAWLVEDMAKRVELSKQSCFYCDKLFGQEVLDRDSDMYEFVHEMSDQNETVVYYHSSCYYQFDELFHTKYNWRLFFETIEDGTPPAKEQEVAQYCSECRNYISTDLVTTPSKNHNLTGDQAIEKMCVDCAAKNQLFLDTNVAMEKNLPKIDPKDWQMEVEELLSMNSGLVKVFRATDPADKGDFDTYLGPGASYMAQDFNVAEYYTWNPVHKDDTRWYGRPIMAVEVNTKKIFHLDDIKLRYLASHVMYHAVGTESVDSAFNSLTVQGFSSISKGMMMWLKEQGYDMVVYSLGVKANTPYVIVLDPDIMEYVGICSDRMYLTEKQKEQIYQQELD